MRGRNGRSVLVSIFAAAILVLGCGVLAAADPVQVIKTIDLAQPLNTEWSVPVNAQITLTVIHMIPRRKYDVRQAKYTLDPAGITTDNIFKGDQKATAETVAEVAEDQTAPKSCRDLTTAVRKMEMPTVSEADVEARQNALQARLDAAGSGCADEFRAKALIAETTLTIDIPGLAADEGVRVTITRTGGPEPIPPPWVLDIHTGIGNGKFLSNYTFGFALNRDRSYFAKTVDTVTTIAEQSKRDKAAMVPLVLFSWLPRKDATSSWVYSWTAGLGYDLSNPVVAAGGLWTWNRNLGIAIGVLGQKQQRLKGKYHVKDPVAANTESKDLTDPTWAPNVFVGISIRSVSALFK